MEFIVNFLQNSVAYIVPMIVLLGLLIFVHELGHFLVAKYYKVRVEVFSLGFGPKLFKFKRGDTVYAISAIPLGGYVKMFGDDPTADVASEHRAYSFTHKPVGQRIAVVLAGPLMNLFFAIVLFTGVAAIGEQALAPKLGDLEPTSAAYSAGLRADDTVVSVANEPVKTWDEMQKAIEKNADRSVSLVVDRGGKQETLQVTPKLAANKNVLSWDRQVGEVDGLNYSSRASIVGVATPDALAAKDGLKTGDIIKSVNGTEVTKWREFVDQLAKNASASTINLEVQRGVLDDNNTEMKLTDAKVTLNVPATAKNQSGEEIAKSLGIEFPELYLRTVVKDSPAEAAGLKKGDRIVSINGQGMSSFEQVSNMIRAAGQTQGEAKDAKASPLNVVVMREGKEVATTVAPNAQQRMNNNGREERRFEIGISPLLVEAPPQTIQLASSNPIEALQRGVSQTVKWTNLTVLSFVRLFQNEVSPKNIGGFLSIGQMAKKSWQIGPSQFLNVMAIISINLFILNLLPVPVLDGGHLVFYTIEALRGAPLSMRKMEIAQQVGLVLLLGLMVFALFNDFSRILN